MTDNVHPFPRSASPPLLGLSQRQPPANLPAEQALLGAILANNRAFHLVSDFLRPEHFADPLHQRLFRELGHRILAGCSPDAVTMRAWMEADPAAAETGGGASYLAGLLAAMVGIINAAEYGRAIQDAYLRREMIDIGERAVNASFDTGISTAETATQVAADLDRLLAFGGTDQPGVEWNEALERAMSAIDRAASGEGIVGLCTGMASVDEAIGGIEPGNLFILGGRPGMGKAQPLDAKVLMSDGCFKPMGDVKLGDSLASIDGAPSRVMGVYPRGAMQTFRAALSDGRSTEVSADHLWEVNYRAWPAPRVLCTREISLMLHRKRYQGRLSVRMVSGHFGGGELPIDPYVLGCLLGDGDISGVTPRLTSADPELVSEVQSRLGLSAEVRPTGTDGISYSIVSTSYEMGCRPDLRRKKRELARSLERLGLSGCASETKFVPAAYLRADRQARLDLLRGLMDTDGWAEAHGSVRYSSCSLPLAEGVRDLVRSLGGCCSIVAKQTSFTTAREKLPGITAYMCRIRHRRAEEFFLLRRKADRAVRARNTVSLNIDSVEPARVVPVRCIAVTHPSKLYVTDDYIVTHNTALGLQWAIAAARAGHGVCIFSLEMQAVALTRRALAAASGVSVTKLKRGWINHVEGAIVAAHKSLLDLPITIEDAAGISVGSMMLRARAARRRHGNLGLIVLDHLHIVEPDAGDVKHGSTWAIGRISKALKAMAKGMQVPVIALAQLSRDVDKRDDKRPNMTDLRMSGDIEQNADIICFVYRPEYYLPKLPPEKLANESGEKFDAKVRAFYYDKERLRGEAELILAKMREGEELIVPMRWHGETMSFAEATQ